MTDEKHWASEETQDRMRLATTKYYNRRVLTHQFFVEEMVLRRNEFAHQDKMDKLSPKWEKPYNVVAIAHPNAYVLEDMQGKMLKNTFNTKHFE